MRLNGVYKTITREEALRLHREMWTDMQKELGDNPTPKQRFAFKKVWLDAHGYSDVNCFCFLCEYAGYDGVIGRCNKCPIDWSYLEFSNYFNKKSGTCTGKYVKNSKEEIYLCATISEILALPERSE